MLPSLLKRLRAPAHCAAKIHPYGVRLFLRALSTSGDGASASGKSASAANASAGNSASAANSAPSAETGEPLTKRCASSADGLSSVRRWGKRILAFGALTALTAAVFAGASEIEKREAELKKRVAELEAKELRSHIIAAFKTPYVAPESKYFRFSKLLKDLTSEVVKTLEMFIKELGYNVLILDAPEGCGTLEALRTHYDGRAGFIDLTRESSISDDALGTRLKSLMPGFNTRTLSNEAVVAEMKSMAKLLASPFSHSPVGSPFLHSPVILVRLEKPISSETINEWVGMGLRVIVLTQNPAVGKEIDKGSNTKLFHCSLSYDESEADYKRVEQFLHSDEAGIAKRFANKANIKLVSKAIGKNMDSLLSLIFYLKNSSDTAEEWLGNQMFFSHQKWLKAASTFKGNLYFFAYTLAKHWSFSENNLTVNEGHFRNEDAVKHLTNSGILSQPLYPSSSRRDAQYASAMDAFTFEAYSAKLLRTPATQDIGELLDEIRSK
jgi:hypothetical protein